VTASTEEYADVTKHVVVLMACHNRAERTVMFFNSFNTAAKHGFVFDFIVTDDGSVDDTYNILKSQTTVTKVVRGNGKLYWARAMRLAEDSIEKSYDGILWVNDDIVLNANAFEKLFKAISTHSQSVLVGQIARPTDNKIIYGGYKRLGIHPLKLQLLNSREKFLSADTFNGNFVYIPSEVHSAVGPIDRAFRHGYADCDFGFRVRNAGYTIQVMPGILAYGLENQDSWPESRIEKIRKFSSAKYSPVSSQLRFYRKHSGFCWPILAPIFTLYPYLRILFFNKVKSHGGVAND
jgi:GT2 family glycosyltransferase